MEDKMMQMGKTKKGRKTEWYLNEQQGKEECVVAVLLQNSGYLDNK